MEAALDLVPTNVHPAEIQEPSLIRTLAHAHLPTSWPATDSAVPATRTAPPVRATRTDSA